MKRPFQTMKPTLSLAALLSAACLTVTGCTPASAVSLAPAPPQVVYPARPIPPSCPLPRVCFTPGQPCTQRIVDTLAQARKSVRVQAYYLTSPPIVEALIQAKQRGVEVKVVLDKIHRTQRFGVVPRLRKAGIPVWIDRRPRIAHSKNMIIDGQIVITGSFNFTNSAQKVNAETLLIDQDERLAKIFIENWKRRRAVAER